MLPFIRYETQTTIYERFISLIMLTNPLLVESPVAMFGQLFFILYLRSLGLARLVV